MSHTMEQTDGASVREEEEPETKTKSRRPPNTAFRQQRLKAWQPILTPKTVLPLFFAVGIIFAPIGGLLLWASSKVQEISIDYSTCAQVAPQCDGTSPPQNNDASRIPSSKLSSYFKSSTPDADAPTWCYTNTSIAQTYGGERNLPGTTICHIQFFIPDTLNPPVLLYYQLTNFYQNHRRYVKSFSQTQLSGTAVPAKTINGSDCSPLEGEVAPDGNWKPYYPCGLIANSRFNDTIMTPVLLSPAGSGAANTTYNMVQNDTAWGSDADLYKPTKYQYGEVLPPPNWREVYPEYNDTNGYRFPALHEDNAFQVWMRTAGLPSFSKLALRNNNDKMTRGRYQVDIYDCGSRLGDCEIQVTTDAITS
ncbi:alkylphosphocholine resistance protein lem3 [Teratosphaeriaceae sp. CCFEE 6253]|nr:alkylphosphocholine resistance protein lem3 [Teratosphaeriaceae sp. CCFEE 6253]